MFPQLNQQIVVLLQVVIAAVLGGLIGWERGAAGKWAGPRTHMLLCIAAMLFVRLGQFMIDDTASAFSHEVLRADPTRIMEAIATGVAFLGAGTIFRDRSRHARGLTTAASMLMTATIGVAVAIDYYIVAIGVALISLVVLALMRKLEPVDDSE